MPRRDGDIVEGKSLAVTVPELAAAPVTIPTVNERPIYLSDELMGQHILLVGGIGQGKTNAIYHILHSVRRAMTADDVAVIFDTKGDYAKRFRRPVDIVINDFDQPRDQDPWNLIADLRASQEADREEILSEIGHTLFDEQVEHSQQPFFPIAAKDIFCAILDRQSSRPGLTNKTIRTFWDTKSSEEIRQEFLSDPENKGKGLLHYISQDGPQTQGVLAHITQLVRDVFIGRFREPGDLSIREAIRKKGGRCIFIEYNVSTGKAQAPVYRVLIDLAIKEALSRRRAQGRVFFFIDEFRLLPRLMHMDHGVNFGREYGLRFIVGMQNHEQVHASYGDEAASILSGFNTVMAFRVGDPETRDFVKGLAGQNLKRVAVPSLVPGPPVQQIVEGQVVEDHHVWDLRPGEAIVFMPNTDAPFKTRIALFQGVR